MEIVGSEGDRYHTTPAFCEGPAWLNRGRRTRACKGAIRAAVGMCSHQLAVELLRLAQELGQPAAALTVIDEPEPVPAPAPSEIVAVELPGWAVFALCGPITIKQKKLGAEDVSILISPGDGIVSLSSGAYHCTVPANPVTGALVVLEADAFAQLWDAVRGAAMETETVSFTIAVREDATGTFTLAGGRIRSVVPSMTML